MKNEFECPVRHTRKNAKGGPLGSIYSVAGHIAGKLGSADALHDGWAYENVDEREILQIMKAYGGWTRINHLAELIEPAVRKAHYNRIKSEPNVNFGLDELKSLVLRTKPKAIILSDTCTVMHYPNFDKWRCSTAKVVFVLPPSIIYELESLKKRPITPADDTAELARKAILSYTQLTKKGQIDKGLLIDGVGWFIAVDEPGQDEIELALSRIAEVTRAFGKRDAKLLLLANYLRRRLEDTCIVFITQDNNLHNCFSAKGFESYAGGFPLDLSKFIGPTFDPDETLDEIMRARNEGQDGESSKEEE